MDTEIKQQASKERQRELLRVIERQLKDTAPGAGTTMANEACLSRHHFQRVFRQSVGETPGEMRRRILMERAAHEIRNTKKAITVIALEAGYQSLEGFSRAFKAVYKLSPRAYRSVARAIPQMPVNTASGVHYHPKTERLLPLRHVPQERTEVMNLTERLLESDYNSKRRMLECARLLSDAQLDAPLAFRHNLMPFVEPERTLREALDRMSSDGWILTLLDAIHWKSQDSRYRIVTGKSVEHMITRLNGFYTDYRAFVQKVEAENLWGNEVGGPHL